MDDKIRRIAVVSSIYSNYFSASPLLTERGWGFLSNTGTFRVNKVIIKAATN